jgi:hypothetical protein
VEGKKGIMKRQHPDNPDLFWCPKCKTYKARREFGYARDRKQNIAAVCKLCNNNWGKTKKKYDDMARAELLDSYIKKTLNQVGSIVTPETIKLKRQQIIMIRTLKQFKEWRKEYESNNTDVQREQRENEEADGRQGHTQP